MSRIPRHSTAQLWQSGTAALAIAVVTAVNILGTRKGGTLQVLGTVLKVGGVAALVIALPFLLGQGTVANFTPIWPSAARGSVFTGIHVCDGRRTLGLRRLDQYHAARGRDQRPRLATSRARLLTGTAVLIAVYVSMTLAYHYVLPMAEVASAPREAGHVEKAVAAVYCQHLLGRWGVIGISILVMCSTFISLNGNALTGPRTYFAMARDGLFPSGLCRVHETFQTPANAILAQGIWAIILTVAADDFDRCPAAPAPKAACPGRSGTPGRS